MRFEIGKGGIAAISLGVILLSTCVFVFGVAVGWDIGSQSQQAASQMATAYPLEQSPSRTEPAPAATGSAAPATGGNAEAAKAPPAAAPAQSVASNGAPRASGPPAASSELNQAVVPPRRSESAGLTSRSIPPETAPNAENAAAPPPETAAAERPPIPRTYRRPYHIQIEAAMDLNGANQMMRRLQQLGYQSHIVETSIDGQPWYKVEVGPYATQSEAAAAESELRARYNAAYGAGGNPAQPGASSAE